MFQRRKDLEPSYFPQTASQGGTGKAQPSRTTEELRVPVPLRLEYCIRVR